MADTPAPVAPGPPPLPPRQPAAAAPATPNREGLPGAPLSGNQVPSTASVAADDTAPQASSATPFPTTEPPLTPGTESISSKQSKRRSFTATIRKRLSSTMSRGHAHSSSTGAALLSSEGGGRASIDAAGAAATGPSTATTPERTARAAPPPPVLPPRKPIINQSTQSAFFSSPAASPALPINDIGEDAAPPTSDSAVAVASSPRVVPPSLPPRPAESRPSSSEDRPLPSPPISKEQPSTAAAAVVAPPLPSRPKTLMSNPEESLLPKLLLAFGLTSLVGLLTARFVHWGLAVAEALAAAFMLAKALERREKDSEWLQEKRAWRKVDEARSFETVEWLNHVLRVVWPLINADYFVPFIDLLEDALLQQVPGIVYGCRVEDLSQGTIPLRIQSFRVLPDDEDTFLNKSDKQREENRAEDIEARKAGLDEGEFINLEVKFAYRAPKKRRRKAKSNKAPGVGGPDGPEEDDEDMGDAAEQIHMLLYMGIGTKLAAVNVPVWTEVVGLEGTMRLRLQMTPVAPFVGHVAMTFVDKPRIEISAKPLGRKMVIDAMNLPLISSYVLHSIERVIAGFIAPKSYTMDVGGLLSAGDGPSDTYSVGVCVVVIHQASGLAAADSGGTSDPFVAISYARGGKRLFNTRVRVKTVDPVFQETAFLLIAPDELRDHERLRLTVFDADRLSSDDPLGKIDISLDKLCRRALSRKRQPGQPSMFLSRTEKLQAYDRGAHVQGTLKYSIAFFPLAMTGVGSAGKHRSLIRQAARGAETPTSAGPGSSLLSSARSESMFGETLNGDVDPKDKYAEVLTGFDRLVSRIGLPLDSEMLQARRERKERVDKLVSMIEGRRQATLDPADETLPSGILAFHIHALSGVEVPGTQKSLGNSKRLGKTQRYLGTDDTSTEGSGKLPSTYVQVILNDEAIFRTRTKALNPNPFINAGSERFVADLQTAVITFVVRDERMRESDPILGIVQLPLRDVFRESCRYSDVHKIVGGLGWGKMRLTLVWRSAELTIPAPLRGWNIGVIEVSSCRVSNFPKARMDRDVAHLLFETSGGSAKTEELPPVDDYQSPLGMEPTVSFEYPLKEPIRVAVRQRYPHFLYIHLRSSTKGIGKAHKYAHGCIPLNRVADGEDNVLHVPLFVTKDWQRFEQDALLTASPDDTLVSGQDEATEKPVLEELCHGSRLGKRGELPVDVAGDGHLQLAGYLDIAFRYLPGVAPDHRSSLAGDSELRYAYEAFETLDDAGELERSSTSVKRLSHRRTASGKGPAGLTVDTTAGGPSAGADGDMDVGATDESDVSSDESGNEGPGDTAEAIKERKRARKRAMKRQERGLAQSSTWRTMSWMASNARDGIQKARKAATGPQSKNGNKMESEGVSHF